MFEMKGDWKLKLLQLQVVSRLGQKQGDYFGVSCMLLVIFKAALLFFSEGQSSYSFSQSYIKTQISVNSM